MENMKDARIALRITISAVIIVAIINTTISITALILPKLAYPTMYGIAAANILLLLYSGRLLQKVNKKIGEEEYKEEEKSKPDNNYETD